MGTIYMLAAFIWMLIYIFVIGIYVFVHVRSCRPTSVGDIVLLLTQNLILIGIHTLQPWFMGPFRVMSTGPGTYFLDLLPRMATFRSWFHTSLLKPARPQPIGPPALEDNSYEVEVILKKNKRAIHDKVK